MSGLPEEFYLNLIMCLMAVVGSVMELCMLDSADSRHLFQVTDLNKDLLTTASALMCLSAVLLLVAVATELINKKCEEKNAKKEKEEKEKNAKKEKEEKEKNAKEKTEQEEETKKKEKEEETKKKEQEEETKKKEKEEETKKKEEKEKCIMKLKIGFTSGMVGLSLIMVVLFGVFLDSISPGIEGQMKGDVKTKYVNESSDDPTSKYWNNMQIDMKCCGSTDYTDYCNSNYTAIYQEVVPWTCCVMNPDGNNSVFSVVNQTACRIEAQSPHCSEALYLHTKGCYRMIDGVLDETSGAVVAALVMSCMSFVMEVINLKISVKRYRTRTMQPLRNEQRSNGDD